MATFRKTQSGKWQAQVFCRGVRRAASFRTKREAQDWATQETLRLERGETRSETSLADAMNRYARDVSVAKRGARWEIIRLAKLSQSEIAAKPIGSITPQDVANWRDSRLREIKPASVRREMELLSAVFHIAKREWGVLSASPMEGVTRPKSSPPRDRRVSDAEINKLVDAVGIDLTQKTSRVVHAFRFAIETAMRAGEIAALTIPDVDRSARVATLHMTKNGSKRRVPLSSAAIALLDALPPTENKVFDVTPSQMTSLFMRARRLAGVADLTFHDSRHEAITRLSKKLDVLTLARMVGHKDIRMLMVYYNESAEDIALRLD